MEKTRAISVFTRGFLHKLLEESRKLENHATKAEEIGQEEAWLSKVGKNRLKYEILS